MFDFFNHFSLTKAGSDFVLEVKDDSMLNTETKGPYEDKLLIPAHKFLPRVRVAVRRAQMRKIWNMARNGRFDNYVKK